MTAHDTLSAIQARTLPIVGDVALLSAKELDRQIQARARRIEALTIDRATLVAQAEHYNRAGMYKSAKSNTAGAVNLTRAIIDYTRELAVLTRELEHRS